MGAKFKIATTVLGDRRVGQIVDNPGLNADETIKEAIVFPKRESRARSAR